jgi:hypothetical protein
MCDDHHVFESNYTDVFQFLEDICDYHHCDTVQSVMIHIKSIQGRQSYCVADNVHMDLSLEEEMLHLHFIQVKVPRKGWATRCFTQICVLSENMGWSVCVHGPFTEDGRAWMKSIGISVDVQFVKGLASTATSPARASSTFNALSPDIIPKDNIITH